ncbi:MAG: hypothetical protein EXR62_06500 [Chloroflexi bacterium]|nr:hypothetical protein [Chloroflexota bacterium]
MNFWRNHIGLVIILIIFLALGQVYSWATPIFEASDEARHYFVIDHLKKGGGLPIQQPGVPTTWEQEGSQPPLYYVLMAILTSWIDTNDVQDVARSNPHAAIGIPQSLNNKNMFIHDPQRENFPYRGTVLAVHLIRWVSLLLAAIGVACTYFISLTAFPGRRGLALGASALHAFNPMFLFISASVNNDTLAITLSSIAFYLILRLWKKDEGAFLQLCLGLVLAAAALTKLNALILVPIAGLAVLIVTGHKVSDQVQGKGFKEIFNYLWRSAVAIGAPLLLLAGWWYWRNLQLYSELTGTQMMVAVAGPRRGAISLWDLAQEWQGFRYSYWAVFGGFTVMAGDWVYSLFDMVTTLAGFGLILWLMRRLSRRQGPGWLVVLMTLWILLTFAGLVRWTMLTYASQGRLMFPVISALSVFLSLGLAELWNSLLFILGMILPFLSRFTMGWADKVGWLVPLPLALVAVIVPVRYIQPRYTPPPQILPTADLSIPNPIYRSFDGRMALIGYDVDHSPDQVGQDVAVGENLYLTLYWKVLGPFDRDYSIYVHILDGDKQVLGQQDTYPGGGRLSTRQLQQGRLVVDRVDIHMNQPPAGTPRAEIQIGIYDVTTSIRLPVTNERGQRVDGLPLTYVKVGEPTTPAGLPPNAQALTANFADMIRLEGYWLETRKLKPGIPVQIILYWQNLQPPPKDYTLFVQLLDENGKRVGQNDHQPLAGKYPTSFWEPGEWISDEFSLAPEVTALAGRYHLEIGWYELATGQRLELVQVQGKPQDTRIVIPDLVIEP